MQKTNHQSDKLTPKNRSFNQFAFHIFNYLIEPQKKPNWKFYQSHQLIHGACNFTISSFHSILIGYPDISYLSNWRMDRYFQKNRHCHWIICLLFRLSYSL